MNYEYEVSAGRYGGEFVIGTLPNAKAIYWSKRDDFEEYFMSWDADDREENFPDVPEEFRIEDYWHDHDQILHECGVEFYDTNWLQICRVDKKRGNTKDVYVDFSTVQDKVCHVDESETVNLDKYCEDNDVSAVYANSFEKGGFNFYCTDKEGNEVPFIINEKFDPKKLHSFVITKWSDLFILNSFQYEDFTFCNGASDTMGKSMNAWID